MLMICNLEIWTIRFTFFSDLSEKQSNRFTMPNFKIQNKKKTKRHKHKRKPSKRKNQSKTKQNDNDTHKMKNSKINIANCFASKPFLKSLYPQNKSDILTAYQQLIHPLSTFNPEMDVCEKKYTTTYDMYCQTLCNYIAPILTQFYAYKQSLYQYNHAGVIAIETRHDDKLQDLLKISKEDKVVGFQQNKMISVAYIPDEQTLISYFKAIQVKQNKCDVFLQIPMSCKNDTLNMWRKKYFPLFINIQADNFHDMIYQEQHTSIDNTILEAPFFQQSMKKYGIEKHISIDNTILEASFFKQSMKKSGIEMCSLLNIQLKEQIIFGMDCMPTISPTNT